jgi:hypothetical protein
VLSIKNEKHFGGLIEEATHFAKEMLKEREQRKKKEAERRTRKFRVTEGKSH